MLENVYHPKHYLEASVTIEPIELTSRLDSCLGQAIQYVMRAPHKGNEVEDLEKAIFYLEKSKDLGLPWHKYRNLQKPVYVLARIFADNTKDVLTRQVLKCLFLSESFEGSYYTGGQEMAIRAIRARLAELLEK